MIQSLVLNTIKEHRLFNNYSNKKSYISYKSQCICIPLYNARLLNFISVLCACPSVKSKSWTVTSHGRIVCILRQVWTCCTLQSLNLLKTEQLHKKGSWGIHLIVTYLPVDLIKLITDKSIIDLLFKWLLVIIILVYIWTLLIYSTGKYEIWCHLLLTMLTWYITNACI